MVAFNCIEKAIKVNSIQLLDMVFNIYSGDIIVDQDLLLLAIEHGHPNMFKRLLRDFKIITDYDDIYELRTSSMTAALSNQYWRDEMISFLLRDDQQLFFIPLQSIYYEMDEENEEHEDEKNEEMDEEKKLLKKSATLFQNIIN